MGGAYGFLGQGVKETVTGGNMTISSDHAAIHAGYGFSANVRNTSVADASTLLLEFKTPASSDTVVHMKSWEAWGEGGKNTFELLEAPTLTTGSTAITPVSRRRIGVPPTSACTLKSDPTSISAGTSLEATLFGGGGAGPGGGGNRSADLEFVLKPNTTYLFRLTNNSGAAKGLSLWVFWYEEPV